MTINIDAAVLKHQQGDVDVAEQMYRQLLAKDPNNVMIYRNLGILLYQKGDVDGSLNIFRNAIDQKFGIEDFFEAYAEILAKSHRFTEAVKLYGLLFGLKDRNEFIKKTAAIIKSEVVSIFNAGEYSKTIASIDICKSVFEFDNEVTNIAGVCGLHLKKYDFALASFSQAIEGDPHNDTLYVNKSLVLENLGRTEEAISSLLNSLKINPHSNNALLNLSVLWIRDGNCDAFIDLIDVREGIPPYNDEVLYNYAYCLKACDEVLKAQKILNTIIVRNPSYRNAYVLLGDCWQTSDRDKAISLYEASLKIKPSIDIYLKMYDLTKAENLETEHDYYMSILEEKFSSMSEVKVRKSQRMLEDGRFDEAKEILSSIPSDDTHAGTANNILGQLAFSESDLESADFYFQKTLTSQPENIEVYNNLAAIKNSLGSHKEAIRLLERSLEINPSFFEALNNLGISQNALGKFKAAIKSYCQVLSKTPDAWNNLYFPLRSRILTDEISFEDIEYLLKDVISEQPVSYFTLIHRLKRGLQEGSQSHADLIEHVRNTEDYILRNVRQDNMENIPVSVSKSEPIALLHFGRSGSGFLHSLIDGHREIMTLPSVFLSEFFDLATWNDLKKDGISQLASNFVAYYEVLFDSSSKKPVASKSGLKLYDFGRKEGLTELGENKDTCISINKDIFITILQCLIDAEPYLSQARLFELVHEAMDRLNGCSIEGKEIFYHIHNPDTLAYAHFISCFPKGKVLMIVRDPLQSCESWASRTEGDYLRTCQRIIQMLHDIDDYVYGMVDSAAIRLEDIKNSPKTSLQELCDWMGISYSDSLNHMTMMEKRWWGDPSSPDYRVDGMEPFGTSSIMRQKTNFFNKQDREVLETLFFPFSRAFGYATITEEEFRINLESLPQKLDNLFAFEVRFLDSKPLTENDLRQMGYFKYFRAELLNKWKVLSEYGTYPNLIPWIKNVVK